MFASKEMKMGMKRIILLVLCPCCVSLCKTDLRRSQFLFVLFFCILFVSFMLFPDLQVACQLFIFMQFVYFVVLCKRKGLPCFNFNKVPTVFPASKKSYFLYLSDFIVGSYSYTNSLGLMCCFLCINFRNKVLKCKELALFFV